MTVHEERTSLADIDIDLERGEGRMLYPLLDFLRQRRWLRDDTVVLKEFPVNGRRVDVSLLTRSGTSSAFELKLGSFARVLEQASYNARLFDRSWVVVGANPKPVNVLEAERFGIGILVHSMDGFRIVVRPRALGVERQAQRRLVKRMRERAQNV